MKIWLSIPLKFNKSMNYYIENSVLKINNGGKFGRRRELILCTVIKTKARRRRASMVITNEVYISSTSPNLWSPSIIILEEGRPVFLLKFIFGIRFSDAPLATDVIFFSFCSPFHSFVRSTRIYFSTDSHTEIWKGNGVQDSSFQKRYK